GIAGQHAGETERHYLYVAEIAAEAQEVATMRPRSVVGEFGDVAVAPAILCGAHRIGEGHGTAYCRPGEHIAFGELTAVDEARLLAVGSAARLVIDGLRDGPVPGERPSLAARKLSGAGQSWKRLADVVGDRVVRRVDCVVAIDALEAVAL